MNKNSLAYRSAPLARLLFFVAAIPSCVVVDDLSGSICLGLSAGVVAGIVGYVVAVLYKSTETPL